MMVLKNECAAVIYHIFRCRH